MADLQPSTALMQRGVFRVAATRSARAIGDIGVLDLQALAPPAILAFWFAAVEHVDPRNMTDLGLAPALPTGVFVLLGLLLVSFALSLRRARLRALVPLLHVLALVVMLYSVTALVEDEPRFDVTYRHVGIMKYIASHHGVDPHLDAYFNWPGFFSLGVVLTKVIGVRSALAYAAWAPLIFNLLALPPLLVLFRWATNDQRLVWLGTWVFFSANWVAQDYLAPQAIAFVLWLAMLAILVTTLGRRPLIALGEHGRLRGRERLRALWRDAAPGEANRASAVLLLVALGIFGAMTTGHQLTPFPALLTVGALTAAARLRRTALPVTMALILAGWISYMTIVFLAGHFQSTFGSISLSSSLSQNVSSRVKGSSGHLFVVHVRILLTGALWAAAALGFARRVRERTLDLALLLIAVVPFVLPIVQPYGGEMLLRVFLFALAPVSFFAAALLYPSRTAGGGLATTAALVVLAGLLLAGFQFARYGNERVDHFTPSDTNTVAALYRIAPPGATLAAVASNLPWKYEGYASYRYRSLASMPMWTRTLDPDPAGVVAQFEYREFKSPTYVISTPSMSSYSEAYDGKDQAIGGTIDLLRHSGLARVVYDRDGGTILRLRPDPYADDPMSSVDLRTFPATTLPGGLTLRPVRFTGALGKRIRAFLVVPPGAARKPGVLFLHGSGGTRRELLGPAEDLARRGAVTITITQPKGAGVRQEVGDARRALDLLAQRQDVDPGRLGVVGYSNGGQTAAVLAGVDLRLKTVGLIAARATPAAVRWIRHTQAHLFFQAGRQDRVVPRRALERLIRSAPAGARIRWYVGGHVPTARMYAQQVAWQARMLGLR